MTTPSERPSVQAFRKFAVLSFLMLSACGGGQDSATDPPQQISVGGVSVTVNGSTSLLVGETRQLAADVRDTQGQPLTGRSVSWSSSFTSVATVTGGGQVSAIGVGSATITASSEGKSGSATLTVAPAPVAVVEVSPPTANLTPGASAQLVATLKDAQGGVITGRTVQWSTSAAAVASVSGTGLITAVGGGSATISASAEGKTGMSLITVQSAVAGVTFTGSSRIKVGDLYTYTAIARSSTGQVLDRPMTWSVSDATAATITQTGAITALRAGSFNVRVTVDGVLWQTTITSYDWVAFGAFPTLGLVLTADVLITNKFGQSVYPDLVMGCSSGTFVLFVDTDIFVTNTGGVSYSFNGGTILSATWLENSPTFEILQYPGLTNSARVGFANQIAASTTFAFAFTEFQGAAKATLFRVSGLAPRLSSLIASCQLTGNAVAGLQPEIAFSRVRSAGALQSSRGETAASSSDLVKRRARVAIEDDKPMLPRFSPVTDVRQGQRVPRGDQ
jgi:hypothetical protein